MLTMHPLETSQSLAEKAFCIRCGGSGETDHSCDCHLCKEKSEDCKVCKGTGKSTTKGVYPRIIDSDSGDVGPDLQPYVWTGWKITITDHDGTHHTAIAERYSNGSMQFVRETGVYLADVVERIAAAMDG